MNKNMRDFIRAAKALGPDYYVEVNRPLGWYLEVGIIQHKLARLGRSPLIYCPEIEGSKLPLVTNLVGNFAMLALSLGCDPRTTRRQEVYDVLRKRVANKLAPEWVPPSQAPVKRVKLSGDDVDLGILPVIHNSKLDAGKYISAGFMIARWPDTGKPNAGIYRHLVMGKDTLGCMINPGNDGAYIARARAELDQMMEVALVIGHHPAVVQASLVRNVAELELMGSYLGEPLEVTKGETVDLPIPAHAEIVIEGIINPNKMSTDGPFAEYLGYYGVGQKPCYVIQVTAVTMREDAIYHHLDSAHREHTFGFDFLAEVALYDRLKVQFPTLKAVTYGWLGTYISLKQRVPGEGRQAALLAVTENYGKTAVAVDDDIDIYNEQEVAWAIATRMVADEDLLIMPGVKGAHLDPVAYNEGRTGRGPMTTHLVIDATKPVEREFEIKTEPDPRLWKTMRLEDYLDKQYLK
jgi:2,5-furandicarboxylate decarboxylase 1